MAPTTQDGAVVGAIEDLLAVQADRSRRPLREALVATLECREALLKELANDPTLLVGRGSQSLGRAVAEAWAAPKDGKVDQDRLLKGLTNPQAAKVRGLLAHLQWAVQRNPEVTARELFSSNEELQRQGGPASPTKRAGDASTDNILRRLEEEEMQDASWPPNLFAREFRQICSPAQRIHQFRQRLEYAHGSLAEAFKSMDMEMRGFVAFGDFYAHLVRIGISAFDSAGSMLCMELFKLLDMDQDDLVSPRDCVRCFNVAAKVLATESQAEALEQERELVRQKYNLPGKDVDRVPRFYNLPCEDRVKLAQLRRFLTLRYGSFLYGLRRMDVENTGYVFRPDFVYAMLSSGYCISSEEAEELFSILDYNKLEAVNLANIEALERQGSLCGSEAIREPEDAKRERVPGEKLTVGIGTGGLFSDPGTLDGAAPKPFKSKSASPRFEDEEALFEHLHASPTKSWRANHPLTVSPDRKKKAPELNQEGEERPGIYPRLSVLNEESRMSVAPAMVIHHMMNSLGEADGSREAEEAAAAEAAAAEAEAAAAEAAAEAEKAAEDENGEAAPDGAEGAEGEAAKAAEGAEGEAAKAADGADDQW